MPESKLDQVIAKLKGLPVGQEEELPETSAISGRIEEIKKRELRRYKESQDKKWANWLEAMRR